MSVIFSPTVAGALFFIAFTINSSKGSASQSPSPRVVMQPIARSLDVNYRGKRPSIVMQSR